MRNFKYVRLTYADGSTSGTEVANILNREIYSYFLGQWFDRGCYPEEDMQKCTNVLISGPYAT